MKIIKKSFVVLIVLILNLIFLTDKVNAATCNATVPDSNVLFEGIGNYSIATAVSNFAKYGSTNLNASYNSTIGKIGVEDIDEIECTDSIVITYTGTVSNNIPITNNKYKITSKANLEYAIINCDSNKVTISDMDLKQSGVPVNVVTHHYLKGTTTKRCRY